MGSSRRTFFQDALLFGAGLLGLNARPAASEAWSEGKKPDRRESRQKPAEMYFDIILYEVVVVI